MRVHTEIRYGVFVRTLRIPQSSMKHKPSESGKMVPAIRLRAMLAGMTLCGLIAVGLPYGEFVIQGTRLGLSSSTPAAFFLLFVLVAVVQPLLGLVRRSWIFSREELLLVTTMMMLATAIPSRGFTGMFLAIISGVSYYASPENNWAEQLIPYIPSWMVPQDVEAVKSFYEGLPQEQPIPWEVWLQPLAWWLLFMGAFYTVLICSMAIMRRQWMDHERLLYPLVQVPLGMIEDRDPPSLFKPFLKNPVLWAGFAIPFLFNTVNALSRYYEFVPHLEPYYSFTAAHNTALIVIRINYLMIGLAYLINTNISFSLWVFFLLAKLQEALCSLLGIYSAEQLDEFSDTGPTTGMLSHQSMGAMIVLVLLGLWMARSHLGQVLRQVWRRGVESDSEELLSYRAAGTGLVAGLGIMAVWLWRSGVPVWAVGLFLFGAFAIFVALTRVIIEAGLSSAVEGLSGAGFLVSGVGTSALGPAGIIAVSYTLAWAGDLLVFMMAPCANSIRMLHGLRSSRTRLLGMMAAAMAIGLVGSIYATLKLGYQYGALNLHQQYFSGFAQEPFRFASRLIDTPVGPHWPGWGWNGAGASVMALLIWARQRLLWWPLHPIGYMVGGTWILHSVWFSVFLAWLVKATVLKYAGPTGYRATRWFFLGMILGQFVVGGVWLVVDGFTGMKGEAIQMY